MNNLNIKIKLLRPNASIPEYATDGAAAADLRAALDEPVVLNSSERRLIPTGIAIAPNDTINGSRDVDDSSRGTVDSARGTVDSSRDTVDSSRGTVDAARDTVDSSRGTVDSSRGTVDSSHDTVDSSRGTVDSSRGTVDSASGASFAAIICARSGLASRRGPALANGTGVVDADYRGEIMVSMINLGNEPVTIEPGERIAQLMFVPILHAEFIQSEALPETARQAGGFGSTGTK